MKNRTSSPIHRLAPLFGSIALLLPGALFADSSKAPNTTALNTAGSWANGIVPNSTNLAIWDSLISSATNAPLGGDLSWLGIKVANVGGTANSTVLMTIGNAASANTLTLGASGIDLSTATQALSIQSKILLGANQTWNIANANTAGSPAGFNNNEDLSFAAQALASFNFGGNTVTTAGAGQITITSGYTLSNGTLNVGNNLLVIQGGASRLTTLDSTLTLGVNAGATLRLQANSGALLSNAPINLNGGTLNFLANNATNAVTSNGNLNVLAASTITVTGGLNGPTIQNGNLTGSAALAINNTTADVVRLLQLGGNNSAYSGTITLGGTAGRATRLNTATAGSAAATWSVSSGHTLQIAGVSVQLGTLTGAGSVASSTGASTVNAGAGNFTGTLLDGAGTLALTKVGAGALTLTGFNSYTGATTVSGGTLLVSNGTLNGTAVSVANTATYAVQDAFSGTVNANVTVADGGTFRAQPLAAGVTLNVPSLTVGTTTGGTINISTAALGNPIVAPLDATAFSVSTGTQLKVTGSALVPQLGIPLISYSGAIGGAGFGGLTLSLPARTVGNLVNNSGASRVDLNITSFEQIKWRGNVNALWDIDPTGADVVGTQNWRTTITNTAARYLQGTGGTDSVTFDDSAVGNTNVNLTTTLTPGGVTVNNTALNYTFSGPGKISGGASLTKTGTGTLTLANTAAYDHTGGTTISAGTLQVGDGVTAGAGILPTGAITNDATIALNRPDNFAVAATIGGTGVLAKNNTNTVNFTAATTTGDVAINAGTLRYDAGGAINGLLSGSATLAVQGGTLQVAGFVPNTFNGTTNVTGGVLQLNNSGGNAIGGTINFTGTGGIQLFQPNQIEDTATINFNKAINGGTITLNETFGTLNNLNGNDTNAQVIANNGFVVTGLVTAQNTSVFSTASGHTASVGGLNVSGSAIIRIAANGNNSTLNVGALGITASGGTIQVGQGVGGFDAVLNLDGDLTTTGNVAFTDGNFLGANLRQINLANTRTFNIGAGTTTTIAPDISGPGGLTKTGTGTLVLTAASASNYTGDTIVSQGTLLTTTSQIAGAIIIGGGTTFGVSIANPGTTLSGASLTAASGANVTLDTGALGNPFSPVITVGTLNIGGPVTLKITGSALTTASGIPLISYTGSIGGAGGFAGLTLSLPGRIGGTLVNNTIDSRVDLNISGVEQVKWRGNVNGNWDIDPDGSGATGTPNWLTTLVGSPTRYFQGPIGIDTVNFDDSATGTTNVNLTTTLAPNGVVVDNNAKNYTFSGPGRITGATSLTKTGTGTLTIANTGSNDFTGGTTIGVGSILQLGDGVTNGGGSVGGTITNDGTLVLNRPDDVSFTNALSGSGTLQKNQPNTVTFTGAASLFSPVVLNAGTLKFAGGGTIGGDISGAGALEAGGGTLLITGGTPSLHTGTTTVSAGLLQLNKGDGVDAIGEDIVITGTGQLALLTGEQIPNTATLTFTGSSADSLPTQAGVETYGNVLVNSSVGGAAGGQVIMRNNFTVLGTAMLTRGILGVASNHVATLNGVNINAAPGSDALLRIAGNGGPSTLNIGAGGIFASGGEIQVKFNVNDQDAVLNLGGDFTATGNVAITNAGYTGPNLNVINLVGGPRAFHITAGSTTTVAPDFGDGDLIKDGDGTLTLNGTLGTGAFTLTANDGQTNITTDQTLASLTIADGAIVVLGGPAFAPAPGFDGGIAEAAFSEGSVQPVPEPTSASLLLFGALGLLGMRGRRD